MDNDDDDGVATNLTAKEIEQEAKEVRWRLLINDWISIWFLGNTNNAKG